MRLSIVVLGLLAALPARAQYIETYLPAGVPGFDQAQGVTVLSRLRPLYADQGVRLGSFDIRGGFDERFGYDSNITGTNRGPSSAFLETSPSVSAQSDWSRNRLGIAASADRFDYFSAPKQSHTNYTVAVGGGWTVLRNSLDVGYSHVHGNELGSDIGAVAFGAPVPFDVDIVRGGYTWDRGRFQFTPNFDARLYQFGNAEFDGQPVSQRFRDRTVLSGGLTTRYSLSEQRGLVLVMQGASSQYLHPQAGVPSNNSQSVLVLPGLDYQANGPWRYRLLLGAEVRAFEASRYGTRFAPVFEGSVIYTPTGLTTITASLRRAIEDPQAEGSSGYTFTGVSVVVDHEWRRNLLLQGRGAFRTVDYFQGLGSGRAYSFGVGATWLLNPRLSLFANYDITRQDGSGRRLDLNAPNTLASVLPSYTQNLLLIGARWRM